MIDEGIYEAKKVGGALGETSTGKDQAAVLFQTLDGNQRITWYGYFTDKTTERTAETLGKLGVKPDLSNIGDPSDVACTISVEHEPDQEGKMRAVVRWVNFGDGIGMKKRLDDAGRMKLSQRIGGMIAKHGAAASRPPQTGGAGAPTLPEDTGDDIPF